MMNRSVSKFSPRLVVAAVTLGLAASAFAMPPMSRGGEGCGMHGGPHMAHGMQDMSRLHGDLKLDAKQEALWQEAEKAGKSSRDEMHERMRKQHEETRSLLNQPGADLRAIAKRMDELRAEGLKQHEIGRDRWLAVYDALNAEQKEKARLFLRSKIDHQEHFGRRGPGRH